jgi:hypothetical protein
MEEFVRRGEGGPLLAYLRHVIPDFRHEQPFVVNMSPIETAAAPVSWGAA